IGVFVGTYSSIYIAGPVVIAWQKKFNAKKK
ncbi:MAG: protein translocase subunit SecF, partial [Candidatus Marinimicrobia bacterium]|nr:protein translocase subunit SecF [Candidatus Neomarinimicrobiota bacterium]